MQNEEERKAPPQLQEPQEEAASKAAPNGAVKRLTNGIPPFIRIPLGVVLVLAGILGFLPLVGFWMVPLGLAVLALDIPFASRLLRRLMRALGRARRSCRRWRNGKPLTRQ